MNKRTTALILSLLVCPALSFVAQAQSAVNEQDARSIALDAYIYFYPLVTMDVTRKQLTNVEPGKGLGAPMNALFNVPTFPTADMRQVVRPTSIRCIPLDSSTSQKSRWSCRFRIRAGAIICCRCSTCGPMCLLHPVGARLARRRPISSSRRVVGAEPFRQF